MRLKKLIVIGILFLFVISSFSYSQEFDFNKLTLLKPDPEYVRRDPSDIIKVGEYYYIYYTKMNYKEEKKRTDENGLRFTWPEGYHGDVYVAVSKDEGENWYEIGPVVKRGTREEFDHTSAFTPNIVYYKKKYYLYYTGVGKDFNNKGYSDLERTAIGIASSDSPIGPFVKSKNNPILKSSFDNKSFDSFRVDDASLRIAKNGDIYLYYKGRPYKGVKPRHTQMGYAIAKNIEGPYKKMNDGKPIQKGGHEVMVWQSKSGGWYSYVAHGHGRGSGNLRFSKEGIDFEKDNPIYRSPRMEAPGLYRPEITGDKVESNCFWGVQHRSARKGRRYIYLKKFKLRIKELKKK